MSDPNTNSEQGTQVSTLFAEAEAAFVDMNAMLTEANNNAKRMVEELAAKNDALLEDLDEKHAKLLAMVEVFNRWTDNESGHEES